MNTVWIIFWSVLILGSVAWYGFLVIYIGIRAGRDIKTMIAALQCNNQDSSKQTQNTP